MQQEATSLNIEKTKALLYDKQRNSVASDINKAPKTKTAAELLLEEKSNGYILSFNDDLDVLLHEEITTGSITELAGLPGSAKTQICLHLCASVQLPKIYGGTEGGALYICTNTNFNIDRLKEIILNCTQKFDTLKSHHLPGVALSPEEMLKKVYLAEAQNCTKLFSCLRYLEEFLVGKNVDLLVVDSIAFPLRQVQPEDRGIYGARIFNNLRSLAEKFGFAVVVTNDMTTRIRNSEAYETPSFGDGFFHHVNTRIILSKDLDGFKAEIVKSRYQEPRFVFFSL